MRTRPSQQVACLATLQQQGGENNPLQVIDVCRGEVLMARSLAQAGIARVAQQPAAEDFHGGPDVPDSGVHGA